MQQFVQLPESHSLGDDMMAPTKSKPGRPSTRVKTGPLDSLDPDSLSAELIRTMLNTFSCIRGHIIPKKLKSTHSPIY